MITQEKIDVTKTKTKDIHPDFIAKIEHVGETKLLDAKKATGKHFRLVHDGKVAFIIEGTEKNETTTIHEVEEFATEQGALDRVKALGLKHEKQEAATLQ